MDASEDLRAVRSLRLAAVALGFLAYWRLIFWDPSWDLKAFDAWLFLPTDPLPQLIFLVAAAVVYRRRRSLRRAMRSRGSPGLAVVPLLLGTSLFVWGYYVDAMDLVLISFMLVSIGGGLLWFGPRFALELAIPWAVLAFAYQAPAVVTNQAFYALRLWSAAHAAALLQLFGVPVLVEGNVISGSGVIAHVIDTCSGLRSIQILTLVAIFYVSWFPARRLRQLLLVVMAPFVAYFFNLIRICVIAIAPTSEFSAAHTAQGLAVYSAAIAFLILMDRVLGHFLPGKTPPKRAARGSKLEAESQPLAAPSPQPVSAARERLEVSAESASDSPRVSRSSGRPGAIALALLAAALLGLSIWMPRWSAAEDGAAGAESALLPEALDGWTQSEKVEYDYVFLWTVWFQEHEYWIYERDGKTVSVFIGVDDRSNRRRSLISRKNAVPRRGFEVMQRDSVSIDSIGAPVERIVAQSHLAHVLTFYWYEGIDGLFSEVLRTLAATDQSPFRRQQPAVVIRVATAVDSAPAARAEDEAMLRAFASSLAAALRESLSSTHSMEIGGSAPGGSHDAPNS